jgi:hypothetical protein
MKTSSSLSWVVGNSCRPSPRIVPMVAAAIALVTEKKCRTKRSSNMPGALGLGNMDIIYAALNPNLPFASGVYLTFPVFLVRSVAHILMTERTMRRRRVLTTMSSSSSYSSTTTLLRTSMWWWYDTSGKRERRGSGRPRPPAALVPAALAKLISWPGSVAVWVHDDVAFVNDEGIWQGRSCCCPHACWSCLGRSRRCPHRGRCRCRLRCDCYRRLPRQAACALGTVAAKAANKGLILVGRVKTIGQADPMEVS